MEGGGEIIQRVGMVSWDIYPGFTEEFNLPESNEKYFVRLEKDLQRLTAPEGRLIFSVAGNSRIYTLETPTKLGIVYEDVDKKGHIGIFAKAESIQFPLRPTLSSTLKIWYRHNDVLKPFKIGIGGFRGIFFED
jgi:hypothetical protein